MEENVATRSFEVITKDQRWRLMCARICCGDKTLPVPPTSHTAERHRTTSPPLCRRADSPQSEKETKGETKERAVKKERADEVEIPRTSEDVIGIFRSMPSFFCLKRENRLF